MDRQCEVKGKEDADSCNVKLVLTTHLRQHREQVGGCLCRTIFYYLPKQNFFILKVFQYILILKIAFERYQRTTFLFLFKERAIFTDDFKIYCGITSGSGLA